MWGEKLTFSQREVSSSVHMSFNQIHTEFLSSKNILPRQIHYFPVTSSGPEFYPCLQKRIRVIKIFNLDLKSKFSDKSANLCFNLKVRISACILSVCLYLALNFTFIYSKVLKKSAGQKLKMQANLKL